MARKRVLIVDDHPLVRFAVLKLLQLKGFDVVGEAESGIEGIQLSETLQPDVVVLDIGLPRLNGINVISHLQRMPHAPFIVIFTAEVSDYYATLCISSGVTGYVRKSSGLEELTHAVEAAAMGECYFPTLTQRQSVPTFLHKPLKLLSTSELKVLDLLLSGMSNTEISLQLERSPKTVSTHKINIFRKLNIHSLAELASLAGLEG